MSADEFDPVAILAGLNRHEVNLIVVGGFAVAAFGVARATRDLDLVVEAGWHNAGRLAEALSELGGRAADESRDGISQDALARRDNVKVLTRYGPVHLLQSQPGVPDFVQLQDGSEEREIGSVRFRVCSLDALRSMKEAAGRGKDLIDLNELDRLADLDPD